MNFDQRLIRKGKNEPREGLVQQARVAIDLATRYEAKLQDHGWLPTDTQALQTCLAILDTKMAKQADERGIARDKTREEAESVDAAKGFIRRLRYALPRVLRETSTPGVSYESFATMGRLGRSTPQIVAYLTRIAPAVERLDGDLVRYFGGARASKILAEVKARLERADTEQEAALAALPAETARIYEAKGRVLELIEDLNRAGRSAFDGDAMMAALFNKDLVLRARNQRRTVSEIIPLEQVTSDAEKSGTGC